MRVEVINTGTELLLGSVLNTHLRLLSDALFPLGLRIQRQVTVPDGEAIRTAIAETLGRADVVFITGGLGPTTDDITREAVAEWLGVQMIRDETVMRTIEERFARIGGDLDDDPGDRRRQVEDPVLIEALQTATQPEHSGTVYSFSCYRATEYVMALAVAREAARCNPELLARIQRQAEMTVIRSGEFHRVFCREYGSRSSPLPPKYYVPGDRTWFRNPDSHSSDGSSSETSPKMSVLS